MRVVEDPKSVDHSRWRRRMRAYFLLSHASLIAAFIRLLNAVLRTPISVILSDPGRGFMVNQFFTPLCRSNFTIFLWLYSIKRKLDKISPLSAA